jgi:hypothetical protein
LVGLLYTEPEALGRDGWDGTPSHFHSTSLNKTKAIWTRKLRLLTCA